MKQATPRNFNLVKKVAGEGCLTGAPQTSHLISLSPNKAADVEKEDRVDNLETRVPLELYHRAVCDPGQLTASPGLSSLYSTRNEASETIRV